MLTLEQIEAAYNTIRWRMDRVNSHTLMLIAEQIKAIGAMNPSSIDKISQLRKTGANAIIIKRELQKALALTADDIQQLFREAARQEYASHDFMGVWRDRKPIPLEYNSLLQIYIEALSRQTRETFLNYSNTTNIDEQYKELVSDAVDALTRGVTDYHSAIRGKMRELGGSGIRVVYESGHTRRLDSAIRMNIIDGTKHIAVKAQEMIGEEIGADGIELSAHPYSAPDHEPAQGRMYTLTEYQKMQNMKPFSDVDGNQYKAFRRPISEWNCRHFASRVLLGISRRRYTDAQLEQWREANARGCVVDEQRISIYEASQTMRQLETKARQQKDVQYLAGQSGDEVLKRDAQSKITRLKAKYKAIASSAGLKERPENMITTRWD